MNTDTDGANTSGENLKDRDTQPVNGVHNSDGELPSKTESATDKSPQANPAEQTGNDDPTQITAIIDEAITDSISAKANDALVVGSSS